MSDEPQGQAPTPWNGSYGRIVCISELDEFGEKAELFA